MTQFIKSALMMNDSGITHNGTQFNSPLASSHWWKGFNLLSSKFKSFSQIDARCVNSSKEEITPCMFKNVKSDPCFFIVHTFSWFSSVCYNIKENKIIIIFLCILSTYPCSHEFFKRENSTKRRYKNRFITSCL